MIEARMTCRKLEKYGRDAGEQVRLEAVFSDDPTDPNKKWADATPSGHLEMYIDNDAAKGYIRPGETYRVLIELVDED